MKRERMIRRRMAMILVAAAGGLAGPITALAASFNDPNYLMTAAYYDKVRYGAHVMDNTKAMQPYLADMDGDGIDDLVLFNPQNANWTIKLSAGGTGFSCGTLASCTVSGGYAKFNFGGVGIDIPVIA